MTTQELVDRAAIRDTLTRYAQAIDSKDWDSLAACICPTIQLAVGAADRAPTTLSSDAFVAHAKASLGGFTATQHLSLNELTTIDGDSATCRASMWAGHFLRTPEGEEVVVLRGFYEIGLLRRGHDWRIAAYAVRVNWIEGDPSLLDRVAASARTG